ncbi:MAG: cell shape-determining protein MreC [Nitrospirales bacterium]|nr:MAG: cell shape-determining protein MreC [Nitrospirales bacterium]
MSKSGLTGIVSSGVRRVFLVILTAAVILILLLPRQTQGILDGISHPVAQFLAVPIQGLSSLDFSIRDIWNRYLALQGVYEQNLQLQQEVDQLTAKISQLREQMIVSEQLSVMLDFQEQASMGTVAARVIGRNATNWYRAIIIDKGSEHGISKEMGVVATTGVVGRVVNVNPSTAIVLLLTDPNIAIAGMIQRSRDEGIVQGTAQGFVRMKYLPPLSTIEIGDMVVTSGLTGDYPRGLPIGHVRQLETGDAELFQSAEIHPMVDFSKLEGVLVVTASGQLTDSELLPMIAPAR